MGDVLKRKNNGKWHFSNIFLLLGISNKTRIRNSSIVYQRLKAVINNREIVKRLRFITKTLKIIILIFSNHILLFKS